MKEEPFSSIEDLLARVKRDKEWEGVNAATINRYPIRFVLFENFADFYQFVEAVSQNVFVQKLNDWLDEDVDDCLLTYSELATRISQCITQVPTNDFIIAPFSEMVRFYDNNKYKEFDSLITTIRAIEASPEAQKNHQRIYIPLIGMHGKIGKFYDDPNTFIWEYAKQSDEGLYNLILTDGCNYDVIGLSDDHTICTNVRNWLQIWDMGHRVKKNIICSSPTIFQVARNAQPDNAFGYTHCGNVFEFLTKGLHLDFGDINPSEEEMPYWEQLAKHIDVKDFDFKVFVNQYFHTSGITDNDQFIRLWFDYSDSFERWLLTTYYRITRSGKGYICKAMGYCNNLTTIEFFSNVATAIFDNYRDDYISERRRIMSYAAKKGVMITEQAESYLKAKLKALAARPGDGYYEVVKLLTPLTFAEKELMVEWLGNKKIKRKDVRNVYPQLYEYLAPIQIQLEESSEWIKDYFQEYKQSKLLGGISQNLRKALNLHNANPSDFQAWYDDCKTVRTIMCNRKDIDVYYWIDGLGSDWIPLICDIVKRHNKEQVFLNEVVIARAELPTTTSVNKPRLESLLPEGSELEKIGDLDEFAHKHKTYPRYIIDEIEHVEKAVTKILAHYNGKKIAFISDHGLTYMAQYGGKVEISGIETDHEGRTAVATNGKPTLDDKYVILPDGKTLCALTYDSLGRTVAKNHGAHGGATPEEVLVPIVIVSSNENANNFNAKLLTAEIDSTNPVIRFEIKGLSSIDMPILEYNGTEYQMKNLGNDIFESEKLLLNESINRFTLKIGAFSQIEIARISTGAEEDTDLFDF